MIKSRTSKLKDVPQNQQLAQQQKGKKKSLAIMKDGLMLSALRFFIYFILFYFIMGLLFSFETWGSSKRLGVC